MWGKSPNNPQRPVRNARHWNSPSCSLAGAIELSWGRLSGLLQEPPTRKQHVGVKGYYWLAWGTGREEAKRNCTGQGMEGKGSRSTESNTKRKRMEVTMDSLVKLMDHVSLWGKVPPVAVSHSMQRDPPHGRAPKGLMILFSVASPSPQET